MNYASGAKRGGDRPTKKAATTLEVSWSEERRASSMSGNGIDNQPGPAERGIVT